MRTQTKLNCWIQTVPVRTQNKPNCWTQNLSPLWKMVENLPSTLVLLNKSSIISQIKVQSKHTYFQKNVINLWIKSPRQKSPFKWWNKFWQLCWNLITLFQGSFIYSYVFFPVPRLFQAAKIVIYLYQYQLPGKFFIFWWDYFDTLKLIRLQKYFPVWSTHLVLLTLKRLYTIAVDWLFFRKKAWNSMWIV